MDAKKYGSENSAVLWGFPSLICILNIYMTILIKLDAGHTNINMTYFKDHHLGITVLQYSLARKYNQVVYWS